MFSRSNRREVLRRLVPPVPIEEVLDFGHDFAILWRHSAEPAVRHGLEHVELRLHAGGSQCAMHSYRVREEQIASPRLQECRREAAHVTEQGRQVWMRQVMPIG